MKIPSNKELRQFIGQYFSDSDLETFCFDYFWEVKDNFTIGMRKTGKVEDLIGYCRHRDLMENLIGGLQQARGELYQQTFTPEQPPKQMARRNVYTPQPRNPKKVFVIHSSQDADLAQQIAADLLENSYEIFITPNSIQPGEKWAPAIDRGLDECGVFLTLLTPHAVKSDWVRSETYSAISMANENEARVFFLDIEQCDVPRLWSARQYIPFRSEDYKQNMQDVLYALERKKALQRGIIKPQPAPEPGKPVTKRKKLPVDAERQQQEVRGKQLFLVFLGWVALMADMLILRQFIISDNIVNYGRPQWLFSLFFMLILLVVGLGFFDLSGNHKLLIGWITNFVRGVNQLAVWLQYKSLIIWITFLGTTFFITSFGLYQLLGYVYITGDVSFYKFVWIAALFLLSFFIGPLTFYVMCSRHHLCRYLKLPSYFYGASTLALLFMLINKYIFQQSKIEWDITVEAIILMVGASIFLLLQMKSRDGLLSPELGDPMS